MGEILPLHLLGSFYTMLIFDFLCFLTFLHVMVSVTACLLIPLHAELSINTRWEYKKDRALLKICTNIIKI